MVLVYYENDYRIKKTKKLYLWRKQKELSKNGVKTEIKGSIGTIAETTFRNYD